MSIRTIALSILVIALLVSAPLSALSQASDTFEISQSVTGSSDTTAPTIPTGLTATAISTTQIDLAWTASTDDVAVAGYQIFRDSVFIATSTLTTYSDTGLTESTTYDYTVKAFDAVFNISTSSATATATTLSPSTGGGGSGPTDLEITDVVVTPDLTSVLLNWRTTIPAKSEISWGLTNDYELGSLSEVSARNPHTAKLDDLTSGTRYYFQISVRDVLGIIRDTYEGSFVTSLGPDNTPPSTITNFEAEGRETTIDLSWTNPPDPDLEAVRIVRSDKFFPTDEFGGRVVYEGLAENAIDEDVEPDVTYYYAAFARDRNGNYSTPAIATARIGEVITDPFEDLPEAPPDEIPEELDGISILDFDFIQDGKKISYIDLSVPVKGALPLTVSIDYDKLPEVLKTIGITLSDPEDESKKFSFLLRVNRDKTRYLATIAPLEGGGRYGLTATVLDFKNQKLKKFDGELLVTEGLVVVERLIDNPFFILVLILLILLLLLIILFFLLKRSEERDETRA